MESIIEELQIDSVPKKEENVTVNVTIVDKRDESDMDRSETIKRIKNGEPIARPATLKVPPSQTKTRKKPTKAKTR